MAGSVSPGTDYQWGSATLRSLAYNCGFWCYGEGALEVMKKFEERWLQEEECAGHVAEAWEKAIGEGEANEKLKAEY